VSPPRQVSRKALDRWAWVKGRIRVVVALQRQWGKVHDMYGAQV
jgi:hypothetical protein